MIQSSFSSARTTVRFFNPCSVLKIFVLSYHLGTILADELARAYESLRELTGACKSLRELVTKIFWRYSISSVKAVAATSSPLSNFIKITPWVGLVKNGKDFFVLGR